MIDDDAIRDLVIRLSRRDRSGGMVIERAAILAEGANSVSILQWIDAHDGKPEALASASVGGGLHGGRMNGGGRIGSSAPRRYVLPPGVLP